MPDRSHGQFHRRSAPQGRLFGTGERWPIPTGHGSHDLSFYDGANIPAALVEAPRGGL